MNDTTNMKTNFNNIIFSTMDYPKKPACVVFFNGCPFKCHFCFNKQTWNAINMVDTDKIKENIISYIPFATSVVFSGGEPTKQGDQLLELCTFSKEKGLSVGIQTNGFYPENLVRLKNQVDKVFLSIKAPVDSNSQYYNTTGNPQALKKVNQTLKMSLPIEIWIVDTGNTKEITNSLGTDYKTKILPLTKPQGDEI